MKASLQLRVGHGLSMTPQLQQSIRLLQLSSIELQAEIQEVLEENPLLEIEENFDYINTSNQQEEEGDGSENSPLEIENIPTELQTDSEWEDTFENQRPTSASHSQTISSDIIRDDEDESGQSLQEHLLWQMRLTPFSELEQLIAIHIIDAIEDDGYFKGSLEDIGLSLGGDYDVNPDEIER